MICIYLKEGPESGWNGILVFYKHNLILIKFTAWGDRQIFKQIFQKTKEKTLNVKSYDGLRLFFMLFHKLVPDLADLEQKSVAIFPPMSCDCDEKWDYCLVGGSKPS